MANNTKMFNKIMALSCSVFLCYDHQQPHRTGDSDLELSCCSWDKLVVEMSWNLFILFIFSFDRQELIRVKDSIGTSVLSLFIQILTTKQNDDKI